MLYRKPNNVRYTDMAIWIDHHVYTEDCDEETLYKYLFFLINMLAHKRELFTSTEAYDDFGVYASNRIYFRLKDKRQFEKDNKGEWKLPRIKSVLNYIKNVLYPIKATFERTFSYSTPEPEDYDHATIFDARLMRASDVLYISDFKVYMHNIPQTIRAFVEQLPYRCDKVMTNNIYLSCLLTFMAQTRPMEEEQTVPSVERLEILYEKLQREPPKLYHLPNSMANYISTLVNEIRHIVAKDLSELLSTRVTSDAITRSMIIQALTGQESQGDDD